MSGVTSGRPAIFSVGGVFVPAHLCDPLWRVLRQYVLSRRDDGGQVRPEVAELANALRLAALEHSSSLTTSARGHDFGPDPDMAPACEQVVPTGHLALRLGVSERHARRVAKAEGIEPIARNTWDANDVAALVARRKGTTHG